MIKADSMSVRPLPDADTYGEDLRGNLQRVLSLAPAHCAGCADYHIRTVAHRATGEPFGIDSDRPQIVAMVAGIAAKLIKMRTGPVDVVIAGSADTGILATVAHAISTTSPQALARCRFTVLDLCPTPLMLCGHYAREHNLDFSCSTADLTALAADFPADLLVLHSVFRFIDSERQPDVLARLCSWIKPGGAMVFSNRIKTSTAEETAADIAHRRQRNERVSAMSAQGDLSFDGDREAVIAGLERSLTTDESRRGEFRDAGQLRRLLEKAPLTLTTFDEIAMPIGGDGRPAFDRKRVLALLERT